MNIIDEARDRCITARSMLLSEMERDDICQHYRMWLSYEYSFFDRWVAFMSGPIKTPMLTEFGAEVLIHTSRVTMAEIERINSNPQVH